MMIETLDREIADTRQYLVDAGILAGAGRSPGCEALMRYAARRDTNHAEIRDGLRRCGFSVFDAGGVGGSLPDLIVGAHGTTFLMEVKAYGGKVSDGQSKFSADWRGGPAVVVRTLEDALGVIARYIRQKPARPSPYGGEPIAWGA
jgi:hypothetical protein